MEKSSIYKTFKDASSVTLTEMNVGDDIEIKKKKNSFYYFLEIVLTYNNIMF